MTVKEELENLKERVSSLETEIQRLKHERKVAETPSSYLASVSHKDDDLTMDELIKWMLEEGVIRKPTSEELSIASEWDALPEEEKQAVFWELDHLPPGPMVSDIITQIGVERWLFISLMPTLWSSITFLNWARRGLEKL